MGAFARNSARTSYERTLIGVEGKVCAIYIERKRTLFYMQNDCSDL